MTWFSLLPPWLPPHHHPNRPARWLSDSSAGLVPSIDRFHERHPSTLSIELPLGDWKVDTLNSSCTLRVHCLNHPRVHWNPPLFGITPSFILTFRTPDLPNPSLRLSMLSSRSFVSSRSTETMIRCFSHIGFLGEQPILLPLSFSNTGDAFLRATRDSTFPTCCPGLIWQTRGTATAAEHVRITGINYPNFWTQDFLRESWRMRKCMMSSLQSCRKIVATKMWKWKTSKLRLLWYSRYWWGGSHLARISQARTSPG